jgi:hypothetical protein
MLLVILGVLTYLVLGTFNSQKLGNLAIAEVNRITGIELKAERFSLSLLKGLALEGVSATSRSSKGNVEFTLKRMLLEHKLTPLFSGTLAIEKLRLENLEARVNLPEKPESAEPEFEAIESSANETGLRLEVEEIRILNSNLLLTQKADAGQSKQEVKIQNFNLDLLDVVYDPKEGELSQAISGQGLLDIQKVWIEPNEFHDLRGQFRVARGLIDLDDLKLITDYGPLEASLAIDLNPVPFVYSLKTRGGPVDLNRLLKTDSGLGDGTIVLTGQGIGTDPESFDGEGSIDLEAGTLPEHRIFRMIESAIGGSSVSGAAYNAAQALFSISQNRIYLEPFRLESEQIGLGLGGWAEIEGGLDLKLALKTRRQGVRIERIPDRVLDLLQDDQGWINIPFQVSGTLEQPIVRPDTEALIIQAGTGVNPFLGDLLDKLLQ